MVTIPDKKNTPLPGNFNYPALLKNQKPPFNLVENDMVGILGEYDRLAIIC